MEKGLTCLGAGVIIIKIYLSGRNEEEKV